MYFLLVVKSRKMTENEERELGNDMQQSPQTDLNQERCGLWSEP